MQKLDRANLNTAVALLTAAASYRRPLVLYAEEVCALAQQLTLSRVPGGGTGRICEWSPLDPGNGVYSTCQEAQEFYLTEGLELYPFCPWCGGKIEIADPDVGATLPGPSQTTSAAQATDVAAGLIQSVTVSPLEQAARRLLSLVQDKGQPADHPTNRALFDAGDVIIVNEGNLWELWAVLEHSGQTR